MRRLSSIAATALAALALTGCGEDVPTLTIKGGPSGDADPEAVEVIEEWAGALAEGDVEKAASYFAIPSLAENGPAAIRIRDRRDAVAFNESLPCGATLIRAEGKGGLVLATFRLEERPGPGSCGAGTGSTAGTAFRIEDGEIAEWRRVAVPGGGGAEPIPSDIV
jgi:hypothetical protein